MTNSQPKRRGHKNVVHEQSKLNIIVYQKIIGLYIKVGCDTRSLNASSGPKTEGVPTNNLRGWGSGPCRL